jgi:thioredoxin-like negative regulator of GroEL
MLALTKDNFDTVVAEHDLVVIDFWAKWCQPCLAFKDVLGRVSSDFPGFCFATVDVEQESELASDFSVKSVPMLLVIKSQVIVFSESGVLPEDVLRDLLAQALDCEVT